MISRVFCATLVAASAASVLALAQSADQSSTPVPAFKTQVEYVEVDALVSDREGRFIRDLKKEDFQILEDGKPQTISTFALVDIPVETAVRPLFASRPVEPDTVTNARPFDGRIYVLVLDALHTDFTRTTRVRVAARQFIEKNFGANDLMAVVFTGGRTQDSQEFTSNKRLLLQAVDKFTGRKLESATLAKNDEFFRQRDLGGPVRVLDPNDMERAANARTLLTTLRSVADWFGGVRNRRKTMLLVSEGIDYDLSDLMRSYDAPSSAASSIISDIRDTITATARSNVSIYAVDPRGLSTLGDDSIGASSFADAESSGTAADNSAAPPGRGIGLRGLQNELQMSQDSLRQLADETGGFAAVNRNDFTSAFTRIVQDNSSYYVLAYYPPTEKRDGKFHKIEVKIPGRPGVQVRSRRGYFSAKGKPQPPKAGTTGGASPAAYEALNSPIPVSGLTMRMFAAPFKGVAPNASVLVGVEMAGRSLSLASAGKVEVTYAAIDAKDKVRHSRTDTITLNLRPDTRTVVEQNGLRMMSRMDLPPGRYQVRVAARDVASGTVGSVIQDLEVLDFYKTPMSVSGLALTSLAGSAMVTVKGDDQLKEALPAPPVGLRIFPQNDEIALFAEIYDNSGSGPHKVDITTSIIDDAGKVVFKTQDERASSELQGKRGGYGYIARIPLGDVPPGLYVLVLDAKSRLGRETSATRQIQIQVVPPVR